MPELRIILLIAGVLFIAAIAGFEWWRARRQGELPAAREEFATPSGTAAPRAVAPLPEINVVREPRVAMPEHLPVIELESTSASGTRRALGIAISDEVAVDVPNDPAPQAPPPALRPGTQASRRPTPWSRWWSPPPP